MQRVSKHASFQKKTSPFFCSQVFASRAAASVSRSGRKPRSARRVHPPLAQVFSSGIWGEISSRMQKKRKKKERKKRGAVTPCWMVPQNTGREKKKQPRNGNSRL